MEKPKILSEQQVIDWIKASYGKGAIIDPLVYGKEAQRDADVEHYEPIIEQEKELARIAEYHKMTMHYSQLLAEQTEGWRQRVEQARQETAREIFEEIELWLSNTEADWLTKTSDWQSLKSKFQEGK